MFFEGTGAEILVEVLRQADVQWVFGVPGDTGVALYDVLSHCQATGPRHILARDERSAASMADAYARVAHRVGVVEASSGGGATFLVGGLGEPYAASVPMLVITSDIHRSSRGTSAITEVDQEKLFSAVTKAQFVVQDAPSMGPIAQEALQLALSGRPGPVSLIIAEDVFEEWGRSEWERELALLTPMRIPGAAGQLAQAAKMIATAHRPAMVLGSGVHWSKAWDAVVALAERAHLAVATTIHGKGAFPDSHPLSLGVVGANGARDYANAYLHEADVVLFVGTRANSTDTNGFQSPRRDGSKIIHMDIDASRAGHNYPGSVAIWGDAGANLEALLELLPENLTRGRAIRQWIAERRQRFARHDTKPLSHGLDPRAVVEHVQALFNQDTYVVGDPGTPTPYLSAYWLSQGYRRDVILPRGHGAMGFAIPAAVGMALSHPHHRVVAFTTDGSLAMACGEMETISRLKLPIILLHLANGSLGWIKSLQHFYMDRRYFGVDFGAVDAVLVAEGFGIKGVRVQSLEELDHVLTLNLVSREPIFIDIPVPDEFEHLPPVAPWLATLVGQGGRPVY